MARVLRSDLKKPRDKLYPVYKCMPRTNSENHFRIASVLKLGGVGGGSTEAP